MKVTILLSTYNGSKFILKQLESIFALKDVDFSLVIRDDGSKDNTVELIKDFIGKGHPITLIEGQNKGSGPSFIDLVNNAPESDFYAFSDQDDYWLEDKLSSAISLLNKENQEMPLAYYSNLYLADENLNKIGLHHKKPHIFKGKYTFLLMNAITGCTCVFNNALAKLLKNRMPEDYPMHDAWVYTVASIFGKTIYDYTPHILYRQHGGNVVGTYDRHLSISSVKKRLKIFSIFKGYASVQGALLSMIYAKELPDEIRQELAIIGQKKKFFNRLKIVFSRNYRAQDLIHTIAIKYFVLTNKI